MGELKTSLYHEHLKAQAKMVCFAGYQMPIQYHSLKEEALAVRKSCGVFDVSHMGEFFLSGQDAVAYTDSLICNHFSEVPVGKAVYSPLLREDGTMIDDLIAYKLSSREVLLCVNGANIQKDWEWISSHEKGWNLSLEDKSPDFSLIALQGPRSPLALRELGFPLLEEIPRSSLIQAKWQGEEVRVARTGYTGELGVEIFSSHDCAVKIWRACLEKGIQPCGLGARDVLRIEAGFPLYGQDINDQLTPYDSGLGWTVKLDKQSFRGKRALETLTPTYRQVKFTLARGVPRAGHKILDSAGQVVGVVTSGTMSPLLNCGIALAHLQRKTSLHQKFVVEIRNKYYDATIHQGSFLGSEKL